MLHAALAPPFAGRLPLVVDEQDTRACERTLYHYFKTAWPYADPAPLLDNWHLQACCDHIQAWADGAFVRLAINIPPGHAKSMIAAVMAPSWEWGPRQRPKTRMLFTSYSVENPIRDAVRARRLMDDPWYQARWGDRFMMASDQNVKSYYSNQVGGFRMSAGFKGTTGKRGDWLVVDDPTDISDSANIKALERAVYIYDKVLSSRLNNPQTGRRLIIMQRLNEQDLTGHALREAGWVHLALPSAFEPDRRCRVFLQGRLFFEDPRQQPGELLWPTVFDPKVLYGFDEDTGRIGTADVPVRGSLKAKLGSFGWQGQHQQRPIPAEGAFVQRKWFQFYTTKDRPLTTSEGPVPVRPDALTDWLQSWDLTFKDLSTSDYVSGGVFGRHGANIYLIHRVKDRLDFPATLKAIETVSAAYPMTARKLIEDAANGPAVISTLKGKISGLIGVPPARLGNLDSRLAATSPSIESGNVWLPHPEIAPWIEDFLAEVCGYPKWGHDDDVSMLTLALLHYQSSTSNVLEMWKAQAAKKKKAEESS
jgi:predicted phage terminase large subunit-like protein